MRGARPDVPEALARATHRAFARAPGERFQTAAAFADALAGWSR